MKYILASLFCVLVLNVNAQTVSENAMDELNPFAPNINETLKAYDQEIQQQTGQPAFKENSISRWLELNTCYRLQCTVYARIIKAEQKLFLYINGRLDATWAVSSGAPGHATPDFDQQPNGRIYDQYSSTKFPGGNYKGLGNMPYAVFIEGGFAIHGTTEGNFKHLGTPASHGCIRLHPENGKVFNQLVRQYGIKDTWITVE